MHPRHRRGRSPAARPAHHADLEAAAARHPRGRIVRSEHVAGEQRCRCRPPRRHGDDVPSGLGLGAGARRAAVRRRNSLRWRVRSLSKRPRESLRRRSAAAGRARGTAPPDPLDRFDQVACSSRAGRAVPPHARCNRFSFTGGMSTRPRRGSGAADPARCPRVGSRAGARRRRGGAS